MKKISKIIISMMLFSLIIPISKVSAATIEYELLKADGNKISTTRNEITADLHKQWVKINGSNVDAFCLEPGTFIKSGEATQTSLLEYFKNGISESEANSLVKKINEYMNFGYGSAGKTSYKYYLATQKLIWEAIGETGFFQSTYFKNIITAAGTDENVNIKTGTINYSYNDGTGEKNIDVTNEINKINQDIKNYYIKPSLCTSTTNLEIAVGETAEFTDNANVLENYTVKCSSGLTCAKKGNKLTVTANSESSSQTISFSKSGSGTDATIYQHDGYQRVVTGGKVNALSCSFGLSTYKNVKTADTNIVAIISIATICAITAYLIYYYKKGFKNIK